MSSFLDAASCGCLQLRMLPVVNAAVDAAMWLAINNAGNFEVLDNRP